MGDKALQRPRFAVFLVTALLSIGPQASAGELPEQEILRGWIQDMKGRDRGPFARIRWFCNDGTVLPPKAYACTPHGGGVQHGEWTERTREIRAGGYAIANTLAGIDVESAIARPDFKDLFNHIQIEQFLIAADDGWILRKARTYRGALQEEDERAGARRLLLALCGRDEWLGQNYLVLRSGARLLRHGAESGSVAEVRQLSAALAEQDPGFKAIRNKIHARPEAADAAAVRAYKATQETQAEFERLAKLLDALYAPEKLEAVLEALGDQVNGTESLRARIAPELLQLERTGEPAERFIAISALLKTLRDALVEASKPATRLALLDTSLALEDVHFALARSLEPRTRRDSLKLMAASIDAVYGAGLISRRQLDAARGSLDKTAEASMSLGAYKETLDYLALISAWATQWQRFHFQDSVQRFSQIEPLAELFTQDQLRGSPLFFYAATNDALIRDANALANVYNELFGRDVGGGLRSLNPGLARGPLFLVRGEPHDLSSDGIYVLPETVADLPPVAGIVTAGEGNPLSHVQLLARNLGIPNVVVDASLLDDLERHEGEIVTLAVSPRGSVRLTLDDGHWQELFGSKQFDREALIRPDLEKLDSTTQEILPLSALRAGDSGRTVGPKAAKLGELLHHYPAAVANGLAIPFGVFRDLLERPYGDSGQSMFAWMVGQYRRLEQMPEDSVDRREETERVRAEIEAWIAAAGPSDEVRRRLEQAMEETFGVDGSYGVFVRSDTNVEDLPGFTGAGLNLTVPHVVGVDNVLSAIPRVWASPFTARAFAWRQAHMDQPEYVFPAVLLMLSVNVDKSGVMVTKDIDSGRPNWLSIAVNEGVGGAVDGQAAESLRVNMASGEVKLMAQATATYRRRLSPTGGVEKIPVSGAERVLEEREIGQLIAFAKALPKTFPGIVDADGKAVPADIEFGFLDGELKLFQIRPFLDSRQAKGSSYLASLDQGMAASEDLLVDLDAPPGTDPR